MVNMHEMPDIWLYIEAWDISKHIMIKLVHPMLIDPPSLVDYLG